MLANPTTTVTILDAPPVDPYTGERVGEVATVTGLPAFLLERPAARPRTGSEGRAVDDPNTDTPRISRVYSLRLPAGTLVTRNSRIRDERTGNEFGVRAVRRHGGLSVQQDLLLELSRVDEDDP